MARVQYGPTVTQLAGSIGGSTFQRNSSGNIARSRVAPANSKSVAQMTTITNTYGLTNLWRELSEDDITSWNDLAAAHTRENKFGQTKNLSGYNWFIGCNSNRLAVGLSVLFEAPVYAVPNPVTVCFIDVDIPTYGNNLFVDFTPTPVEADTYLFIYATPPISQPGQSFESKARFILRLEPTDTASQIITSLYEGVFGFTMPWGDPFDAFIGCFAYTVLGASGIPSPGIKTTKRVSFNL